jgi:uncharacterized protein (TIGR00725 family)
MKRVISVCGSDEEDPQLTNATLALAEEVGRLIAERKAVLVCGGRGGVMKAACKGVRTAGGLSIGILPDSKNEANEYVDVPIITGLGHRRNILVVSAGDVIIGICGRWGTLNEISFAMILKKPVILIKGTGGIVDELISGHLMHALETPFIVASSAQDAVEKAFMFF